MSKSEIKLTKVYCKTVIVNIRFAKGNIKDDLI